MADFAEHKHAGGPFLQASLLCEDFSTDGDGRHTFINEFSEHTAGYSQKFLLVNIWRGEEKNKGKTFQEKVEIIAPDGRVIGEGKSDLFSFSAETHRRLNQTVFEGIDFTHTGKYWVSVYLAEAGSGEWVEQAVYPLIVTL